MKRKLSIVVAVARNGVIGDAGRLPWHLPRDLARFKALTLGKPIIMGRRTFESVGRPLPGRLNVVVSRTLGPVPGCVVVGSLDDALALPEVQAADEACVIGGERLFAEALPRCTTVHLTRVEADVEGDVRFDFSPGALQVVARESFPADPHNPLPMTFLTYALPAGSGVQ